MCWLLHFFAIFVFLLLCKSLLLVSKPSYCSPSEHISFRASLPIFFFLLSKSTISVTYLHYLYTFKLPKIFCILKNESHSAFFQVSSFKIQIQIPRFHFFSVFYPSTPKGFLFFFLHFFVETLFLARFASLIRFDFFP